jgi:predicted SAM-dependent methyltransferase
MKLKNKLRKIVRTKKVQYILSLFYKIIPSIKLLFERPINIFTKNKRLFENKYALEIGGPTPLFQRKNRKFPIYAELLNLDNCNFSEANFWSNLKEGELIKFDNKNSGKQIIADASDLSKIKDSSYDILLNSHVIEHIANPIKALFDWKRVIKEKGILVMVVPHKDGTYDHKRPVTKLNHLIEDYNSNIADNDTTHFHEVLELHDIKMDTSVRDYDDHYERTTDNSNRRIVHHHVFDTQLVVNMIDYIGFKIIDVQLLKPYNIIIIAQKEDLNLVNNDIFLNKEASLYKGSIFPTDRI